MRSIPLVRNDLDASYRPVYYTDRYLLKKSEANSIDIDGVLDFDGLYGRWLHINYE